MTTKSIALTEASIKVGLKIRYINNPEYGTYIIKSQDRYTDEETGEVSSWWTVCKSNGGQGGLLDQCRLWEIV